MAEGNEGKIITLSTLSYYDEQLKKWVVNEHILPIQDELTKLINDSELEII